VVSISTDSPTVFNNDAVWTDANNNLGVFLRQTGPTIMPYNFDGSADNTNNSMALNTAMVVEWRHEGGTLFGRVNGAGEQSVASGTTSPLGSFILGGEVSGGITNFGNFHFFECVSFNAIPTQAERDALVANMMAYIGA